MSKRIFTFFIFFSALLLATSPHAHAKEPVPSQQEIDKAKQRIDEAFRSEIRKARTGKSRADLAKKLIKESRLTKDSAGRFALLFRAVELAAQLGRTGVMNQAVSELKDLYEFNAVELYLDIVRTMLNKTTSSRRYKAIYPIVLDAIDEAVRFNEFTAAKEMSSILKSASERTRVSSLVSAAGSIVNEINTLEQKYQDLDKYRATLKNNPKDPSAKTNIGKYVCFYQGNWDEGLPLLASGNDQNLSALAKKEIEESIFPEAQSQIADDWWDLALKENGVAKRNLLKRASHWYSVALPEISGLLRANAEARLIEVGLVFVFDGDGVIFSDLERFAPVTLEAWVQPEVGQTRVKRGQRFRGIGSIIGGDIGGKFGIGIGIIDRFLYAEILNPKLGFIETKQKISSTQWSHVAAIFEQDKTLLYLNGRKIAEGLPTKNSGGTSFVIGCMGQDNYNSQFIGKMRCMRITKGILYPKAFTPEKFFYSNFNAGLIYNATQVREGYAIDQSRNSYDGLLDGVSVRFTGDMYLFDKTN